MPTIPPEMLGAPAGQQAPMGAPAGPSGVHPANFMLAAADLHNSSPRSMPQGPSGATIGSPAKRPRKRAADLKVVR